MTKRKHRNFLKKAGVAVAFVMTSCFMSGALASCDLLNGLLGGSGIVKSAITLSETSHTMYIADSYKLTATTSDSEATVTWTSANEKVATVKKGTVTGIGVGTTTITASLDDGTSATCEITVLDRTITISETEITINIDEEKTYTLTAEASDNGTVTWSTSDSSVAIVSGGVVTGLNPGDATITAQRGAAKVTCTVHVIMPSRPADWRELDMQTNANCVAMPDVWHYWADGSSGDCSFATNPYYGGGEIGVSIDSMTMDGSHYFMFRYQPSVDKDGEALAVGDTYSVTFKVVMSLDGELRYGGPGMFGQSTMTAGVEQEITWEAKIGATEPFSIRPQNFAAPSVENPLTVTVTDISFTLVKKSDGEGGGETGPQTPVIEIEPNVLGTYELERHTNAECLAAPGVIHYWADGDYVLAGNPAMADGTTTFSFSQMTAGQTYQLRYQPDYEIGTQYAITFTATLNRNASITYGTTGSAADYHTVLLNANEETTITYIGTVNGNQPFSIKLNSSDATDEDPVTLTLSSVGIMEYEEPETPTPEVPEDGTPLASSNNAGVVADPGTWYYMADGAAGTDYEFIADPSVSEEGVITYSFNSTTAGATYQLRYQPDYDVGTGYRLTATVTVSADCRIIYGTKTDGTTDHYPSVELAAGESYEIDFTDTVNGSYPFSIQIRPVDNSAPIVLTVKDVVVTEYTPEEGGEETVQYTLEQKTKSETVAAAGIWAYNMDTGVTYSLAEAAYDDGTITFSFTSTSDGKGFYLRYQPDLEIGTSYTVSFTAVLNRTSDKGFMCNNDTSGHYDSYATEEGVAIEVSFTDVVMSGDIMQIKLMGREDASEENPLTLIITNIVVTVNE